jgi:hypothetical protein
MKTRSHPAAPATAREPAASTGSRRSAPAQACRQGANERLLLDSPRLIAQRRQIAATFGATLQREEGPDDEELQMKSRPEVAQRQAADEEEELLQGRFPAAPIRPQADEHQEPLPAHASEAANPSAAMPEAPLPNRTGMSDALKAGIESLSGLSMDHVRVHYNSAQPAQLNALAYAQGSDIHLAPGQEQHLPHEAWHVVQQAHGRVRPTMQLNEGVPVNDDAGLEHEADVMGSKASQMPNSAQGARGRPHRGASPLQRVSGTRGETDGEGRYVGAAGEEMPLDSISAAGQRARAALAVRGQPPEASGEVTRLQFLPTSVQRQAGHRAVAAVARATPGVPPGVVVQRTPETAAQALFESNQTKVYVSTFTPEFNAAHGVTKDDKKAVQAALNALLPKAAPVVVDPTKVSSALLFKVTTGNSGGQSYSPRGDEYPHVAVEWSKNPDGTYKIKKFHYSVSATEKFWWNTVAGGAATFDEPTGLSDADYNAKRGTAAAKAQAVATRLGVTLGAIPAL